MSLLNILDSSIDELASTPVTGATIAFNDTDRSQVMYITPAGTLATLTITFPSATQSRVGQTLTVVCTQIVTALTLSSSGGTFLNALTAFVANGAAQYRKVSSTVWAKVSGV